MNVEILTRDDLQAFRLQLIEDIKSILFSNQQATKAWLRSSEVRKLMKISSGTLQSLRVSGKLKATKIGGIHYYRYTDVQILLDEGQ